MQRCKNLISCLLLLLSSGSAVACEHVYTIGAYDEAFSQHAEITKLGPLSANQVPPSLPKTFLEADGSYGGGEAFCTIQQARNVMIKQIRSGVLPANENWHVYRLDADWKLDTYELHPGDFRIKHAVKVLKEVG